MRCDEQTKKMGQSESLMKLDWHALGTLVRARSAMSMSRSFLKASQVDPSAADSSYALKVLAIDYEGESI